jgi:hypothetical protein
MKPRMVRPMLSGQDKNNQVKNEARKWLATNPVIV